MYFDLSVSSFFLRLYSASTVSKQITRKIFGLSFEADSDRTVSVAPPTPKCSDDDPFFVLGQSNSTDNKAPKPNCSDDDPLLRTNSASSSLHFGCSGLVVGAVTLTLAWQHIHAGVGGRWPPRNRRYHPCRNRRYHPHGFWNVNGVLLGSNDTSV